MVSAGKGKPDVVQLLLEKGMNLNLKDLEGATALDHAIEAGQTELAKLLLAKGATSRRVYKNEAEITAATTNFALLEAAISSKLPNVQAQLAKGADVNARNSRGETAL